MPSQKSKSHVTTQKKKPKPLNIRNSAMRGTYNLMSYIGNQAFRGTIGAVSHISKSAASGTAHGTKRFFKELTSPFHLQPNVKGVLAENELSILYKLNKLYSPEKGRTWSVNRNALKPDEVIKHILGEKEKFTYADIKAIIEKDLGSRTQHDKDYNTNAEILSYINNIYKTTKDEEIKRLKALPDEANHAQQIFFLYYLLENLRENKYTKGEPLGNYYRFPGNEEDVKNHIENGAFSLEVGDLKCEVSKCGKNSIIDLTSGGRKNSKTRKRRSKQ